VDSYFIRCNQSMMVDASLLTDATIRTLRRVIETLWESLRDTRESG